MAEGEDRNGGLWAAASCNEMRHDVFSFQHGEAATVVTTSAVVLLWTGGDGRGRWHARDLWAINALMLLSCPPLIALIPHH